MPGLAVPHPRTSPGCFGGSILRPRQTKRSWHGLVVFPPPRRGPPFSPRQGGTFKGYVKGTEKVHFWARDHALRVSYHIAWMPHLTQARQRYCSCRIAYKVKTARSGTSDDHSLLETSKNMAQEESEQHGTGPPGRVDDL